VIDGLGAGHLGPYGNTWIPTPTANRLAAESLVFDRYLIDSPRLDAQYESLWRGLHAAANEPRRPSIAAQAAQAGLSTTLVSDEPRLLNHPLSEDFEHIVPADPEPAAARGRAGHAGETQLARVLAAAADRLATLRQPGLLWVHAHGLLGPWDAPLELRRSLADEDDPAPPDILDPPAERLSDRTDPDHLLGLSCAYGGQVMALDTCLGGFLEAIHAVALSPEPLVVLTSPRGYPLGEHGVVGPEQAPLATELVHAPLLVRFPERQNSLLRCATLAQPCDLSRLLSQWLGLDETQDSFSVPLLCPDEGHAKPVRDFAWTAGDGQSALHTPAWTHRERAATDDKLPGDPPAAELYVKPDDRWEANNVADLCPSVATAAREFLGQLEKWAANAAAREAPPLDPLLLEPAE